MDRSSQDGPCANDDLLIAAADGGVAIADIPLSIFREEVLAVGRRHWPDLPFQATDEGLSCGELRFSLGNLYSHLRAAQLGERSDAIAEWLGFLLTHETGRARGDAEAAMQTWDGATPLLRPRLTHRSATDFPPGLVFEDFCGDLVIFYAIDCGRSDRWLTADLMAPWNVPLAQVRDTAIGNLKDLTASMTFAIEAFQDKPGRYAFIATGDGYDASRILLPDIRAMLLEHLGDPVFVGLPAKDMMICWSADMHDHAAMVRMFREAIEIFPYPLSSDVYALSAEGLEVLSDHAVRVEGLA